MYDYSMMAKWIDRNMLKHNYNECIISSTKCYVTGILYLIISQDPLWVYYIFRVTTDNKDLFEFFSQ
jgi:hypothetical protein